MPDDNTKEKTNSYQEMEGWPGTPGTERMNRARRLITDSGEPPDDDSDIPDLTQDAQMLYIATAAHAFNLPADTFDPEKARGNRRMFGDVMDAVSEADSQHIFGAVTFVTAEQNPGMIEPGYVFALIRDPEWMGASTYLPTVRDRRVTIFESSVMKDCPGLVLIRPVEGPSDRPEPGEKDPPQGGQTDLLKQIVEWHGAASCHWVPNDNLLR